MDPLSDTLALLRPSNAYVAGLDAGGDWCVRFTGFEGIKFNAIIKGACWVLIEGTSQSWWVEEGDCFLMTRGKPFTFATDLSLPAIQSEAVYANAIDGMASCNGGGEFFLVGGRFDFGMENARLLFESLPPLIHLKRFSDHASVLHWGLERLATELRTPRPGGKLVCEHLAHIMLVEVLRLHLAEYRSGMGWFGALADQKLGRVVSAMHADPARRWTLDCLVALAGMSRSSFAQKFKRAVGLSPMDYLTRWRMLVAAERLRRSNDSVSSVAFAVGYESESAFSTAFKRTMLATPSQFQREESIRSDRSNR
jgi:AraC-like DNA-binding protein